MRDFYMGCMLKANRRHANQQNESAGQMVARLSYWIEVVCVTNHRTSKKDMWQLFK